MSCCGLCIPCDPGDFHKRENFFAKYGNKRVLKLHNAEKQTWKTGYTMNFEPVPHSRTSYLHFEKFCSLWSFDAKLIENESKFWYLNKIWSLVQNSHSKKGIAYNHETFFLLQKTHTEKQKIHQSVTGSFCILASQVGNSQLCATPLPSQPVTTLTTGSSNNANTRTIMINIVLWCYLGYYL